MSISPEQKSTLNIHLVNKDNASYFTEELDAFEAASFNTEEKSAEFTRNFRSKYEKLLEELNLGGVSTTQFSTASADIKEYLLSQDYMKLTLSFSPTKEFLSKLQEVVSNELKVHPMFEVELNKSIIGGALVDYKGIHLDLSLASLIEKYLKDNTNAILSEL